MRPTHRLPLLIVALCASASLCTAAEPRDFLPGGGRHRLLRGDAPPGMVGASRLYGLGPLAGYFQPVRIGGPTGVQFSLPVNGSFLEPTDDVIAGMMIGGVYRFRVTNIPFREGAELFPTVEVIDRTYPPPGLAAKYPIEVALDVDDLYAALGGQLVTRIVFLEDPQTARPERQTPTTRATIEVAEYQDALEMADRFGRPVAIVRIGSKVPPNSPVLMPQFFFGHPVWQPIERLAPVQPAVSEGVSP